MMRPDQTTMLSRPVRRMRGFSLIELVVVMAILAIMATIAAPSLKGALEGSKVKSLSNAFVAAAQLARSEAIKRNMTATLCSSADGAACGGDWADGWVVLAGGAVIHSQGALPNGVTMSGNVTSITFQPTGLGADCAVLTLQNEDATQQRVVTVSASGRANVYKTTTFSCS